MSETIYLRKKSDPRPVIPLGELFIWTPILAEREDMEIYVLGKIMAGLTEISAPKPEDIIIIRPSQPVQPGDSVLLASQKDEPAIDPNRITMIVEAIKKLDPKKDYTKKTTQRESMPRVESIELAVGFKLHAGEREIAWEEVKVSV